MTIAVDLDVKHQNKQKDITSRGNEQFCQLRLEGVEVISLLSTPVLLCAY